MVGLCGLCAQHMSTTSTLARSETVGSAFHPVYRAVLGNTETLFALFRTQCLVLQSRTLTSTSWKWMQGPLYGSGRGVKTNYRFGHWFEDGKGVTRNPLSSQIYVLVLFSTLNLELNHSVMSQAHGSRRHHRHTHVVQIPEVHRYCI